MTVPQITALRLNDAPADTVKDVLFVGAGLGTGVQGLWGETAQQLTDRFHVVGWDLPGHDASPAHTDELSISDLAQAVADLVRSQHETGSIAPGAKVYYAGVSINGAVALQLGLDHGDLFDGIAPICTGAKIGEPASWKERAELVEKAGTPTMVAGSAARWFAEGFIEAQPTRATTLLHTLQDADRHSYARLCEALAGFDVRERLGEISTPIVSIQGSDDQVCSVDDGVFIAENVQHGTAEVVDGVAHQAPVEKPEVVAELLRTRFA